MEADVRIYKTPENGAVILQIKRGKIRVLLEKIKNLLTI